MLASTIWSGRYQRLKESILLRTLGASRAQIRKILCAEYFFLGVFASCDRNSARGRLELGAGEVCFQTLLRPFDCAAAHRPRVAVPLLTVAIGLAASRGVGNAPPLAILRAELD